MLQWTSGFGFRRSRRKRSGQPLPSRNKKSAGFCGPLERRQLLSIQGLEERVVLAWDTTLGLAATADVSANTVGNTTTFTATGTGANVSWADVELQLSSGFNVVVDSGTTGTEAGDITDLTGAILGGLANNVTLTLQSGTGAGLVGNVTLGTVTTGGTDDSIVIEAAGSAASSGAGPITTTNLTVDAATGITTNTSVSNLSASNTTSGDIDITQAALPAEDLTIGGAGVTNSAATGTIDITNLGGSITVGPGSTVQSSNGHITLAATDLDLSGTVDSGTANTTLTNSVAGEAIDLGTNTPGTLGLTSSELNNVTAGVLQVGSPTAGTINVSAAVSPTGTNVLSLVNGGTITEAAAGSITIADLSVSSTGPVTLNSANNVGTLAADTTNGFSFNDGTNALTIGTVDGDVGVTTSGAPATLTADNMTLSAAINLGTTATVALQPFTAGQLIDLGGANAAGTLGLSNTELNEITAGTLEIGNSTSGNLTVVSPISLTNVTTLGLESGGAVAGNGGNPDLTVTNLAVRSASGITLETAVSDLAFDNATSGNVVITDSGALTIAAVDGLGSSTNGASTGTINLTDNNNSITVGTGSGTQSNNGNITLAATDLVIDGTVNSGTARTTLMPSVAGGSIDLGTNTPGTLGLTASELNNVTAGVLQIGSATAGTINVSAAIAPTGTNVLTLVNNGTITEAAVGSIAVSELRVSSTGPVTLTSANDVGTLAADTTNAFSFTNGADPLGIGTVDGVTGITTHGGDIALQGGATITISHPLATTTGGSITIQAPAIDITTAQNFGSANVTLITDNLTVAAPLSGTGILTFEAANDADNIDINGSGTGLSLTAATLAELTGPFSKIVVGDATATGKIIVDAATTFTDAIELDQKAGGAGEVFVDGTLTAPGITINGSGDTTTLNADLVTPGVAIVIHDSVILGAPATITLDTTNGGAVPAGAAITIDTPGTINDDVAGSTALVLKAGTAGMVTLSGSIGSVAAPKSLDVTGALIDLGGSSVTTGAQTYHDPVALLAAATTLSSSGGGDITFDSTLNGASALTVDTAGTTTFGGAVGGTTALTSITTDAPGTTAIDGGAVTTTAGQTYNDNVTSGANATLTSTGGQDITLAQKVDGAFALTVNTSGTTTFGGVVGGTTALTSVTTDAPGATAINGGAVTTTAGQTYNDNVTIGAATTLISTGGGDITFAQKVDGAFALTIDTSGTTTFGGVVGGTTALTSVTTDAPGATAINGGAVATTAAQIYNDNVTIGAATTLTSTGGGDVTFAQKVDGAFALTVNTASTTTFGGMVGGTTALTSVTTDAPGTTAINGGAVTTTSGQTYNDNVTVGAATTLTSTGGGDITFAQKVDGAFALTVDTSGATTFGSVVGGTTALTSITTDAPGTTAINGGAITTTTGQTYNDNVTLGAATTLTSTGGGDITFAQKVDGAFALTVDTSGTTTFGGVVGGATALVSVTTDAPGTTDINGGGITTTAGQSYNDNVILSADATLTSTGGGDVTFAQKVDGAFALTVDTAGITTFGGVVGGTTALTSLTTDAPGTTAINGGAVTTTGGQTYNDNVTLGAATTLTSTGGGDITLAQRVDGAFALTVDTAGTTTFGGVVGGTTALVSVTTDAPGTTAINGGSVTTTAGQTYNDNVTLGAATTLTSTGGGDITLAQKVDGAFALTVDTSGTTTFGGVVGGTTALTSITTDAPGTTAINGGAVTTTAGQTYNDNVTLGAATTLASTGGGDITFAQKVDGAFALTVDTAGTTTFGGVVGGTTALISVTTDAPGTTAINGGAITTTAAQTLNDNVTLGAATTLTSTGGGDITFAQKVDGAFALTVNTAGITTFGGAVGGTTALTSITTDAPGTTAINGGAVTTTAGQTYNDKVTLGAASTTLTSTGGGDITFGSTLDGASALTVNTSGATTFAGIVGGVTPLTSITTDAPGTTAINGGAVTTTAGQAYNDNVTLGVAATTLTSTGGGGIAFAQKVDGASALTVKTSGATTFGGGVGGTTALISLTTDAPGSTAINGGAVTTTGAQTYNDSVTLGAVTTTLTSTGGANITFGSTLDGASALTVDTTGTTTFDGAVGSTHPLQSLSVTGMTALNGGLVNTLGSQTYDGAVRLGANDVLNVLGSSQNVTFNSTVQSPGVAYSLTIETTGGLAAGSFGRVIINGDVGGAGNPLAALTITSGPFTLTKNVTTTGNIVVTVAESAPNNLGDDLTLTGASMTSTAGSITLQAGDNLTIDAASTVTATAGTVTIRGDFNNNDTPPSTVIDLDGSINSPTINVFGGPGNATINVQKTLAGTTMNINEMAGGNTVNLSSTAGGSGSGTLAGIQGIVNVNGSGNDTLNLDDRVDTTSPSGTLTASSVTGLGMGGAVNYTGLGQLNVLLGSSASLDFNVQGIIGSTSVSVQGQGAGTIDVGDSTNKLISKLDGIVGPLTVSDVQELNLNDAGSTRTDTLGSTVATYNVSNTAISRGAPGALPNMLIQYQNMGAGTIQINGAATIKDIFNVFLPNPAQTQFSSSFKTIELSGGTTGGGSVRVVAPQQNPATAPPGFAYTAHVGTFGSADPIQIQNVQTLYMYGSPVVSNNFSNDTSVSAVLIGGDQPDTLTGGTGPDVIFGGGTPLTGPGDLLTARSAASYIFAELAPLFLPGGGFTYQQFSGNANTVLNGGGGTVVSLTQGTTINNASTVLQNNAHIDVITWLTARFAPLGSLGSLEQQAQTTIPSLAFLQPPPAGPAPLPVAPVTPNSTAWQNYVAAAFNDVFGGVSPAGLSPRVAQRLDMSQADFAHALVHSDQYYEDVIITPAYQTYLGRAPDAGGLAFWTRQMEAGLTDEELEAGFIGSDEFFMTQGGGTNSGWVDALYQKLLGRPADAAGKAFWLAQLAAGESRAQVALGFTTSVEREQQRVTVDYETFLGRQPDAAGLEFWVSQFAHGLTNEDVVAGFVGSDEYFNKHS
jgi:hypothetical protein